MRSLHHPDVASLDLATVLNALADPVRLQIIGQIGTIGDVACGGFDVPVSMSTLSHHLKVLREAGLIRVTQEGSRRHNELRLDEIEDRFPGILSSVLASVRSTAGA